MPLMPMSCKTAISFLILMITAVGCGGGGGGGGGDTTPPTISITSPTSSSTYTSTTTPLTIAGSASDNVGVSTVTWSCTASGGTTSGTCTGTTSWRAQIPLTAGLNTITVTAKDAAGNTGTDSITVTYLPPVTLSGTITVPSNYKVDSTLNDLYSTYTDHSTPLSAQSIPNPVTLGGYVNLKGDGEDGNSGGLNPYYAKGNPDDYYSVSLSDGDTVILYVSGYDSTDKYAVDMDLYIYDTNGNVLNSVLGPSSSLAIAADSITGFTSGNTYLIHVQMDSSSTTGYSNYVLSIGTQSSVTASHALSSSSDFVPGHVIVRFKDQDTATASVKKLSDRISSMNMSLKASGYGHISLASFDLSNKSATFKALGIEDKLSIKAVNDKTQKKLDTLHVIKALRRRSDVETADPNYIVHAINTVPDDTYYSSYQWNMPLINLPEAWDTTTGSSSVVVAVVDTGVLINHPDLENKLTYNSSTGGDGYDFVSDTSMSNDGDGIDPDPDDPGDLDNSDDTSSFHGTHVAGIIGAATNNSIGVAGVSWNTLIMPVRVLGKGGGTSYDILQGVKYAAGLVDTNGDPENDSGTVPAKKADIINLSLGDNAYSQTEADVYAEVRAAGVIVIAAAGNDSLNEAFYPADYTGVVSVGAVDRSGNRASYSNYGSYVEVAAPGGDSGPDGYKDYVLSTCGDDSAHIKKSSNPIQDDYAWMAGTSIAAPHVSGVVALMKAVDPGLTPDDLDGYLKSNDKSKNIVDDIDDTATYGYGLIDAYKAVLAASSGTAAPTVLTISPVALDFGEVSEGQTQPLTSTLTASQIGAGTISITNVNSNADWLTISASSIDSNGLGTYTVNVNTTNLSAGSYSATITFTSSSNSITLPVQVQVASGVTSDVGPLYVLLWNPSTQKTVYSVLANYNDQSGTYSYSFSNESQGTYEIYAGTDFGNTGYIGNNGDAYGAYMTTDQPVVVGDQDMSGLDFSVNYFVTFPTATGVNEDKSNYIIKRLKKVNKPEGSTNQFAADGLPLQREVLKEVVK